MTDPRDLFQQWLTDVLHQECGCTDGPGDYYRDQAARILDQPGVKVAIAPAAPPIWPGGEWDRTPRLVFTAPVEVERG